MTSALDPAEWREVDKMNELASDLTSTSRRTVSLPSLSFLFFCPSLLPRARTPLSPARALERYQQLWSPFPVNTVAPWVCLCDAKTLPPRFSFSAVCLSLSQVIFQRLQLSCFIKTQMKRRERRRKGSWLCVLAVPRSFLEYDRYFGLTVKS